MSHDISDFAKSLLASGRADIDPEHLALERALLARLEESRSSAGAEARIEHASKGSHARWLFGGAAVGIGVLAWILMRSEHSPPSRTQQPAQIAAHALPVSTGAAPEASAPTSMMDTRVAVTPDSLPSVEPSAGHSTVQAPPADLLRDANQLRAQSRWADAAKKYDQVLRQRADSPEAYPATVALAKLAVDHLDDPRRALALYDHALAMAPEGGLAEEAEWGRARTLRSLGRRGDERSALRSFLSNHPSSLLSAPAAERLKSLEAD